MSLLGAGHHVLPWDAPAPEPTAGVCECEPLPLDVERVAAFVQPSMRGVSFPPFHDEETDSLIYGYRVHTTTAYVSVPGDPRDLLEIDVLTHDPISGTQSLTITVVEDDGRDRGTVTEGPITLADVRQIRANYMAVAQEVWGGAPWGAVITVVDATRTYPFGGTNADIMASNATRLAALVTNLAAKTAAATAAATARTTARDAWLAALAGRITVRAAQVTVDAAFEEVRAQERAVLGAQLRQPYDAGDVAAAQAALTAAQAAHASALAALSALPVYDDYTAGQTYRTKDAEWRVAEQARLIAQCKKEIESGWSYEPVEGPDHDIPGWEYWQPPFTLVPEVGEAGFPNLELAHLEVDSALASRFRLVATLAPDEPAGSYVFRAALRRVEKWITEEYSFGAWVLAGEDATERIAYDPPPDPFVHDGDAVLDTFCHTEVIIADLMAEGVDGQDGQGLLLTGLDEDITDNDAGLRVEQFIIGAARRKLGFLAYSPAGSTPEVFARETAGGPATGAHAITFSEFVAESPYPPLRLQNFSFTDDVTWLDPDAHPAGVPLSFATPDGLGFAGQEATATGLLSQTATSRTYAGGLTLTLSEPITTESLTVAVNAYVEAATTHESEHVLPAGSVAHPYPAFRQLTGDHSHYSRARLWLKLAPRFPSPFLTDPPQPTVAPPIAYPYRIERTNLATGAVTVEDFTLTIPWGVDPLLPSGAVTEVVVEEGETARFLDARRTADARAWNPRPPTCVAASLFPQEGGE